MPRKLRWLCILPALASLTPTAGIAAGMSFTSAMQTVSQARQVPLPLLEATTYVNSRWEWIPTPAIDGGIGPMHITPSQMQAASALSGHSQAQIASDVYANIDAGAALLANAHTSGTDLGSWQPAVVATQGAVVTTQIYDALRSGETRTTNAGERITLAPQTVPAPSSAAPAGGALAVADSPDYPPATWNPANPANYSYANRPRDYPVQMVIIHDIEGTYGSAIQHFQNPSAEASAHYVVSDAGQITQMVHEHDIAWHAGNWDYNTRAIGIEHEGYAYAQPTWYTTAMYDASAQLTASICSRWGVPMDRNHVIGHYQVPDPNDPNLFGGADHHTDPGPYWDWTYYMSKAQADANALPSPPHMGPDPIAVMNSQTSATVTWQPAGTCHVPIGGYTVTGQPGNLSMSLPASATSATFNGLQAGVAYTFTVTATNPDGQDTLTAYWRCSAAQMGAAPSAPQPVGTTVQFSGTSGGCPNPRYQFWTLAPGSSTWTVAQGYSSNATFSWNTAGKAPGTYHVSLWARDATSPGVNSNGLGSYDAFVPGSAYTLNPITCTSAGASPVPSSPQTAGTAVTITATASGCPNPRYQFWIQVPGSSTWSIAQAYSTSATFNWNTTPPAGTYRYSVWARDASSTAAYDAFAPGTAYTLTTQHCTSASASAAPASPQAAGTTVTVTGSASGCPNPRYEFWVQAPGGSWRVLQAYSSSATFTWNTTPPAGTYRYSVWVRDASSTAGYDTYFPGTAYTLTTTPCTSASASATPASPQTAGTTVTITASASGCSNPRYEFWVQTPGSSTWTVVLAYSSSATFNWNTTGLPAGNYRYSVWVRDASSGAAYDAYFPGTAYTLS